MCKEYTVPGQKTPYRRPMHSLSFWAQCASIESTLCRNRRRTDVQYAVILCVQKARARMCVQYTSVLEDVPSTDFLCAERVPYQKTYCTSIFYVCLLIVHHAVLEDVPYRTRSLHCFSLFADCVYTSITRCRTRRRTVPY